MAKTKYVQSIPIPDVMRELGPRYFDSIVACDADGVLVNFDSYAQRHASASLPPGRTCYLTHSRTYFHHRDPATGVSRDEMGRLLRELMGRTRGGMGELPFYPGAIEAIQEARTAGIGTRVLTSLPGAHDSSPDGGQSYGWGTAREGRTRQFLNAGIVKSADHVIFCDAHVKPIFMLDKLIWRIPVLIDDRASTLVSARNDHGLIAVGIASARPLRLPKGKGLIDPYGVVWYNSLQSAMPAIIQVYAAMQALGLLRGQQNYEAQS